MTETLELLNNNISKSDYIVVGCSSGPDSMCLLDILYRNNYKVICAHVNHNIREESKNEFIFLKNYCMEKQIPFESLELDKIKGNEYYYRKKRYAFYKSLADKYNTKYIATAHHGDDLIETILMRITRGSNLKGYEGFSAIFNEHGYIMIKPLIYYTKDEIIDYNKKNNVPYFNDKTNDDDIYTRNRYRHNILPFLKSENKDIHKKYLKFSRELAKAKNYIQSITDKEINNNYKGGIIDLNKFNMLDDYIKECELETVLSEIYVDDIDKIHMRHIETILNQIKKGTNFKIDLPKNITVKREYDNLIIAKNEIQSDYRLELKSEVTLPNGDTIEMVEQSLDTSNYVTRLNSSDLNLPLYIRNRQDGDKMEIKNLKGEKKLKNIFIDEKIPASQRDAWPVLIDSKDNIIWLPGLKKSKFDNDKSENYDIILRYKRKERN